MNGCEVEGCLKTVYCKGVCPMHYRRIRLYGDPGVRHRIRHSGSDAERFWAKVQRGEGCWTWMAYRQKTGYGHFARSDGRKQMAHRMAYELSKGPIPEGHQLDHICHNKACVNPDHLRPVTNKQNNENPAGVRVDNRYGYRGVGLNKRTGKYRARVHHEGRERYAGEYATPDEAAEAARQLRLLLFTHNDADRRRA